MWISFKGAKGDKEGLEYPYDALCPSDRTKRTFNDITDVHCELTKLYDIAKDEGFNLGESLYTQSFFFVNNSSLLDSKCQNRIKEYQFCKKFSCPPSASLESTPVDIIDDFMIIDEEVSLCLESENKKRNK